MAKISRPIVYAIVLGVVGYAAFVLTEPDAPKKRTTHITKTVADAPKGFSKEDLTASYPRYTGGKTDAFRPKLVSRRKAENAAKTATGASGEAGAAFGGVWTLTGITEVNGVLSALMENVAADQVVFLTAGQTWNGLRVAAIEPEAVILVNAQGKRTRMGFPIIADEKTPAGAPAPNAATGTTGINAARAIPQVPPMPIPPLPGLPGQPGAPGR